MKKLNKILLVLITMLSFNGIIKADEEVLNNYDNDTMLLDSENNYEEKFNYSFDDDIKLEKKINGSNISIGNNITTDARVKGVNIILGNQVNALGISDYKVLVGNNIDVKGEVLNDALILGNNITISSDAIFGRDVLILANNVIIKGTIKRDIMIYASSIELSEANILGNAKLISESIKMDGSKIGGILKYNENTKINNVPSDINVEVIEVLDEEVKPLDVIMDFVWGLFNKLFTLLVMSFIIPKVFKKIVKLYSDKDSIVKNIGVGLLSVIVIPFITLLLLFSTISISVSFISIMFYVIFLMISTTISSYVLGNMLWNKFIKKSGNVFSKEFLGVVVYYLVSLIPFIGGFVTFIFVIYGFGSLIMLILESRKAK